MRDPIEAAAQALWEGGLMEDTPYDDLPESGKQHCRQAAEITIKAYLAESKTVAVPVEPTEAMIRAGSQATLLLNDSDVRETYRAMIAASIHTPAQEKEKP